MKTRYDLMPEDRMRFLSVASILMALWSSHAMSSIDDPKASFLDDHHPKGTFRYEGPAPGGLTRVTYIPDNPEPMWKRLRVFAPTIKMVRIPLPSLSFVVGTSSACFLAKKYFGNASVKP